MEVAPIIVIHLKLRYQLLLLPLSRENIGHIFIVAKYSDRLSEDIGEREEFQTKKHLVGDRRRPTWSNSQELDQNDRVFLRVISFNC
jgi:hypothetical protein